jgi:hypothetical protein
LKRAGLALLALVAVAGGVAVAREPALSWFPDRPVAWSEHDDEDVPRMPETNDLQEERITVTIRDSVANEADRILAAEGKVPAQDVNAMDEVPCSTWFCARNHLHPMTADEVARGPVFDPPVLPLTIVKGKDEGAATGFIAVDARGNKFMVKFDPAGHLGLVSSAESVGERVFHAAGYNVAGATVFDFARSDLKVSPKATFKLFKVEKRPITEERVTSQLGGIARRPDGRYHAVAIPWIKGQTMGSFDMLGRRPGDPNDRIPHEHRRSLRASWILFAWLSVLDSGPINTMDSYVEAGGRHFVRHHILDLSCAFGSSTAYAQGPQDEGEYLIEIGRTLRALFTLGIYQRPFQTRAYREEWKRLDETYPSIGFYPAESFDPDTFRGDRRVPAHMRMTARDAYWGAKIVTAFTDEQLRAMVATAQLPGPDSAYLEHAMAVRRDIIGRRYMRPIAAVENPTVSDALVCFDDLAVARGYASPSELRYLVDVSDGYGRPITSFEQASTGAHACVAAGGPGGEYRVVSIRTRLADGKSAGQPGKASRVHLRWRAREGRFVVVGLERDE